ncbi:IclR family transcriptional regulator [Halococcus hamelinensis]|uniref:IclR family transcriptional regulator n=1 Tax=Halococcus hamelinensis 100A6 TaxID=1132509 RepID=M0M040_9EURY|nr:IclR family transcriptional regulator [Halococcus hamelinensis]EMA39021.1 IclR family transcriptional regulator [Halococcus hamelinensis 100A6]
MVERSAPVQTTETTIAVIGALVELEPAGVSAVADRVGIPTSTAFDHLKTLEHHEFVVGNDRKYRLGTRFLSIGGRHRSTDELYRVAEPEIAKMAYKTGEHANLVVEEFGKGVFLAKVKGEDAFRLDTYIGKRVNLQTTSAGKAILSCLPDERIEEIIDRHGLPAVTPTTITDRGRLFEEIDRVRERGFATDDEERIQGVRCVAAPLRDGEGGVIGAVSISGPKSGMRRDRFEETIPDLVLRTANVIEVNMKYQ